MALAFLPCTVYYLIIPTLVLSMSIVDHKRPNVENTNMARLTNSADSGRWENEYAFPF